MLPTDLAFENLTSKPFSTLFSLFLHLFFKPRYSLQQKIGRDGTVFEGQVDYAEDVPRGIIFEGGKEAAKGRPGDHGGGRETERFVEDMKGIWCRRHSRPFLFRFANRKR